MGVWAWLGYGEADGAGAGPDRNAEYKQQFAAAYNVAGERAVQLGKDVLVARLVMKRLGYTDDELDVVGDVVGRMQGVGNPHPTARIAPGDSVIDLGCGLGIDALLASSKVGQNGLVTGVDISQKEIDAAAELASSRGLDASKVRFLLGDMEAIPVGDASADVVISNGGFCLVPDKPKAFGEIERVLKPGGRMAICCTTNKVDLEPGVPWPACMEVFMKLDEVGEIVRAAGLVNVEVDDTDSKMDVWDLEEDDVAKAIAAASDGDSCSHARKAAQRRLAELRERQQIRADEKVGVHWGDPKFQHLESRDINAICARVCISAQKPGPGVVVRLPTPSGNVASAASVHDRQHQGSSGSSESLLDEMQLAAAAALGVAAVAVAGVRSRRWMQRTGLLRLSTRRW